MSCARDTGLIPAWHEASPELAATAQSVPCHQHRSSPKPHPRPALSWASLAGKESQTCLHSWLQRNNFNYRGGLQDPVSLLWVMPKKKPWNGSYQCSPSSDDAKILDLWVRPFAELIPIPIHMAAPVKHFHFSLGWMKTQNSEQWDVFHCTFSILLTSREGFTSVRKRNRIIKDPDGFRILNSSEIISNCIKLLSINQYGRITPN